MLMSLAKKIAQVFFFDQIYLILGGQFARMPLTATDYRGFSRQCIKWADQSANTAVREAFLSLALDWAAAANVAESPTSLTAHRDTSQQASDWLCQR